MTRSPWIAVKTHHSQVGGARGQSLLFPLSGGHANNSHEDPGIGSHNDPQGQQQHEQEPDDPPKPWGGAETGLSKPGHRAGGLRQAGRPSWSELGLWRQKNGLQVCFHQLGVESGLIFLDLSPFV